MRCTCCDKNLTDYESTLKHAVTGAYLDTCVGCLSEIAHDVPMPVKARKDLIEDMVIHSEVDELTEQEYNIYNESNSEENERE
jgi:hypothetical protein